MEEYLGPNQKDCKIISKRLVFLWNFDFEDSLPAYVYK